MFKKHQKRSQEPWTFGATRRPAARQASPDTRTTEEILAAMEADFDLPELVLDAPLTPEPAAADLQAPAPTVAELIEELEIGEIVDAIPLPINRITPEDTGSLRIYQPGDWQQERRAA